MNRCRSKDGCSGTVQSTRLFQSNRAHDAGRTAQDAADANGAELHAERDAIGAKLRGERRLVA